MVGSNNSIFNRKFLPILFGLGIIFALLVLMIRIVFLTYYIGDKIIGTYKYKDVTLVLEKNGMCELQNVETSNMNIVCKWKNNLDKIVVKYSYKQVYEDEYTDDSFSFIYKDNKLIDKDIIFKKEKAIK